MERSESMLRDAFDGDQSWKQMLSAYLTEVCSGHKLRYSFKPGTRKVCGYVFDDKIVVEAIMPRMHLFIEITKSSLHNACVLFYKKGDREKRYLYHASLDNASAYEIVEDAIVTANVD